MKCRMHRFLSLLMVLALVCGMVPTAFAASSSDYEWDTDYDSYLIFYQNCKNDGHIPRGSGATTTCRVCGATGYRDDYYDDDYSDHEHEYEYYNASYHYEECMDDTSCDYWERQLEPHSHSTYCIYCDYDADDSEGYLTWHDSDYCDRYGEHDPEYDGTQGEYVIYSCDCGDWAWAPAESYDHEHVLSYESIDEDQHKEWCTVTDCDYEAVDDHDQYCDCDEAATSEGLILTQNDNLDAKNTYTPGDTGVWVEVSAALGSDVTGTYTYTFSWRGNYSGSEYSDSADSSYVYLNTKLSSCTVSCTVTATNTADSTKKLTGTVSWTATADNAIEVEAVVYNTSNGYVLSNTDDEGDSSIVDQISSAVNDLGSTRNDYVLDYVIFGDVSERGGTLSADTRTKYYYNSTYNSILYRSDLLGEVIFTPTDSYVGTVEFPFTAYYYDDNAYNTSSRSTVTGVVTFNVKKDDLAFDILYTTVAGEDVLLDEDDFAEFWKEQYPNGTLSYVRFSSLSASKGKLYNDGKQISTTTKCYYNSTDSKQTALDGLSFVPKSSSVTSVEINFTASGTTRYTGSSSATVSGTVTILYTAKGITPIEYQINGNYVDLNPADFIAKYKEVMGVTSSVTGTNLTIRFLNAPVYGTLYLDSSSNDYFYTYGTELTEEKLPGYKFSCGTNTLNGIEDVSYAPSIHGTAAETISYACYSGGNLKFIGTIAFNVVDPVLIEYITAGVTPVTLSRTDFIGTSLTSDSLYFGTPSSGKLYRNYANGTGTAVTAYDKFSSYNVSTLTYVPAAGYVGVVEIPFYASTAFTAKPVGTLKIYVGKVFTDVVGRFAWSAPYINKLSAQGIVTGKTLTTYCPGDNLKYGEALKAIMMAAGYPEQAKLGTHWASGYLLKAYRDGLVSSASIDLEQYIDRETVAVIAAKALGLASASKINAGITGPTDTTNGYVYALYNAGIVSGDNSSGKNCYYGNQAFTRAELSKIICNVGAYYEENN